MANGPITATAFNPTGSGHYGYYWFGDTSLTTDHMVFTYYSTPYRYIWHKDGLSLGNQYWKGATPTTIYRSIYVK